MGSICVQPSLKRCLVKGDENKDKGGELDHTECVTNDIGFEANNLFKSIIHHLSSHFQSDLSIECIVLELFVSHDPTQIHLRKAESKSFDKDTFSDFELCISIIDIIEKKFLHVYEILSTQWNKSRFFINIKDHDYLFEYKFDSDLMWVQSIYYGSSEYQRLSLNAEDEILDWDGLPNDFFRSWIN